MADGIAYRCFSERKITALIDEYIELSTWSPWSEGTPEVQCGKTDVSSGKVSKTLRRGMHLADMAGGVTQALRGRGGKLDPQPQPTPLQGLPGSGHLPNALNGVACLLNRPLLWAVFPMDK